MEYIDALKHVLMSGASLTINHHGSDRNRELVLAAMSGGGVVTFVGAFGMDEMAALCDLGKRHVAFDLAKYKPKD